MVRQMTKERLIAKIDEFLELDDSIDIDEESKFFDVMAEDILVRCCLIEHYPHIFDEVLSSPEIFEIEDLDQLMRAVFICVLDNRWADTCD